MLQFNKIKLIIKNQIEYIYLQETLFTFYNLDCQGSLFDNTFKNGEYFT
jgi:hypothetical protein